MAKILFVLALLVVVAVAQQTEFGVCRPTYCVNRGAACDYDIPTNVSATTRERYCKGGDYCKVANATTDLVGVCTALVDVGGACTPTDQCRQGLFCTNKFCNRRYLPGAECKVANDCLYYAENGDQTVSCNNGKCAGIAAGAKCSRANPTQTCLPPNVCSVDGTCAAALGAGGACGADEHCQRAFFCNASTCTARIAAGQACDIGFAGDQQCVDKYMCVPNGQTGDDATKGTCKAYYAGVAGSVCEYVPLFTSDDETCGENLACLAKAQGSTNAFGACGPAIASSRRSCNASSGADNTNACNANEICVCNQLKGGAGVCYTNAYAVIKKGAKGRMNSATDCEAKCSRTDWPCLEKCESKICNYRNNVVTYKDNIQSNAQTCVEDDDYETPVYRGYVECSSGSLVQISFGLVALIAAMLL